MRKVYINPTVECLSIQAIAAFSLSAADGGDQGGDNITGVADFLSDDLMW